LNRNIKISVAVIVTLLALVIVLNWQAKRIITKLVVANTPHQIDLKIGGVIIIPFKNSIRLTDVAFQIKDEDSDRHSETFIHKLFLDVTSLWHFFSGGMLVIEKLECEGVKVILPNRPPAKSDSTHQESFTISALINKLKKDAVRFQINEMVFRDINLTILNEDVNRSTEIKHLQFKAYEFYLSIDSVLKRKPRVEFSLPKQSILLPNGMDIAFDTLFFQSVNNSIQVDALVLHTNSNQTYNRYHIESERVRLANFNFAEAINNGIGVIDSVYVGRTTADVQWKLDRSQRNNIGFQRLPQFNVHYLAVGNLAGSLLLSKDSIEDSYTISNSSLIIEDLQHKPDSSVKINAGNFDLMVAKYSTFLSKNNTSISFDTVRLQKNSLSLLNFKVASQNQINPILQTSVFLLKKINWDKFLFAKKLIAKEAIVYDPIVYTTLNGIASSGQSMDSKTFLSSLEDFVEVDLFTLKNADAFLILPQAQARLLLKGASATIYFDGMIKSSNPDEALQAIEYFSLQRLNYSSEKVIFVLQQFKLLDGEYTIKDLVLRIQEDLNLTSSGVVIDKLEWSSDSKSFSVNGLGWNTMDIAIANDNHAVPATKHEQIPAIYFKNLLGKNTFLNYSSGNLHLKTQLPLLTCEKMQLGDTLVLNELHATGLDTRVQSTGFSGLIGSLSLSNQSADFKSVSFTSLLSDTLSATVEQISFKADLQGLINKNYSIEQIKVSDLKTEYSNRDSIQHIKLSLTNNLSLNGVLYIHNTITIDSVLMESGPFNITTDKFVDKPQKMVEDKSKINLPKLTTKIGAMFNNETKTLGSKILSDTKLNYEDSLVVNTLSTQLKAETGAICISLNKVRASHIDSTWHFMADLNSLALNKINAKHNQLTAIISSGSLHDLPINSDRFKKPWELIHDLISFSTIRNLKASLKTHDNLIQFDRFDFDQLNAQGILKGFEFRPLKDKDTFLDDHFYQTNYINTKIGTISFHKPDPKKLTDDSLIHIPLINVSEPALDIYRDKTHPFLSEKIKPLPTNAIQKLGIKLRIDTLLFTDGNINYTEKSRITEKEGSLNFTNLQGRVRNIKTTGLGVTDTLYIRASTRFLDSALVQLRVRESYFDTLGSFLMTTKVSPFHTSILNPALIPLVAVEFKSGFIDTLQMRAVGREYESLGSMRMLYHGLKVDFINKNDTSRQSVKNIIMKFAANNFVIKTNNRKRIGTIYYERDRHRAVFQYWVKMILSGVTTSVGAKSNKKQIKKYMEQLNQKKLPPIKDTQGDF